MVLRAWIKEALNPGVFFVGSHGNFIASMYDIFTYTWLNCMVNVRKYTIHRCYGNDSFFHSFQKHMLWRHFQVSFYIVFRGVVWRSCGSTLCRVPRLDLVPGINRLACHHRRRKGSFVDGSTHIWEWMEDMKCENPHVYLTNHWVLHDVAWSFGFYHVCWNCVFQSPYGVF